MGLSGECWSDLNAARERDPAARSRVEVALLYPGVHAVWGWRISHWFWERDRFLVARAVSQGVRAITGVEIHPGASIGSGLFVDHGSGVVIGETSVVGRDVTLYQGVTLGGTSLSKGKRHPTLGDGVVVGAGAKILGDITIGDGAKVGANAVVVRDVAPGDVVIGVPAHESHRDDHELAGTTPGDQVGGVGVDWDWSI
jgi:serine O-acetyltransferase